MSFHQYYNFIAYSLIDGVIYTIFLKKDNLSNLILYESFIKNIVDVMNYHLICSE